MKAAPASIVPPLIVNVLVTPPSALVLLMFSVPALRIVPPVKVFVPESVQLPVPFFVTEPPVVLMILVIYNET